MQGDKKKILTIDDEPDERLYLATLLEDNGYATDTAEDGNEGMEKAKATHPGNGHVPKKSACCRRFEDSVIMSTVYFNRI